MKRFHNLYKDVRAPIRYSRKAPARLRGAALCLAVVAFMSGCSSQPITVEHELTLAAIGAVAGAAGGALLGSQTRYSLPLSIFIGAAGVAGIILLYEEVQREAADANSPPSP